ncbi:hypothetical protein HY380_02255 [Candidatus Saccharibacteria bacterium]|nr:hypothetical protein [Candidatus Saccharibacteria bacterium]
MDDSWFTAFFAFSVIAAIGVLVFADIPIGELRTDRPEQAGDQRERRRVISWSAITASLAAISGFASLGAGFYRLGMIGWLIIPGAAAAGSLLPLAVLLIRAWRHNRTTRPYPNLGGWQ